MRGCMPENATRLVGGEIIGPRPHFQDGPAAVQLASGVIYMTPTQWEEVKRVWARAGGDADKEFEGFEILDPSSH